MDEEYDEEADEYLKNAPDDEDDEETQEYMQDYSRQMKKVSMRDFQQPIKKLALGSLQNYVNQLNNNVQNQNQMERAIKYSQNPSNSLTGTAFSLLSKYGGSALSMLGTAGAYATGLGWADMARKLLAEGYDPLKKYLIPALVTGGTFYAATNLYNKRSAQDFAKQKFMEKFFESQKDGTHFYDRISKDTLYESEKEKHYNTKYKKKIDAAIKQFQKDAYSERIAMN